MAGQEEPQPAMQGGLALVLVFTQFTVLKLFVLNNASSNVVLWSNNECCYIWQHPHTESWVDVQEGSGEGKLVHNRSKEEFEKLLASAASEEEMSDSDTVWVNHCTMAISINTGVCYIYIALLGNLDIRSITRMSSLFVCEAILSAMCVFPSQWAILVVTYCDLLHFPKHLIPR